MRFGNLKYRLVVLYTVVSAGVLVFYAYKWMTDPASVVPKGVSVENFVPKIAAGRNLAVAFTALLTIILKKREALGYILLTWGLMEIYDAGVGLYVHVTGAAIAPFINGLLLLLASFYLLRSSRSSQ